MATFAYTFKRGGWETLDTLWFVGANPPARRICVSGNHRLRLLVAVFVVKESSDGCINYGGLSAAVVNRVQASGRRGETIQVTQDVAPA